MTTVADYHLIEQKIKNISAQKWTGWKVSLEMDQLMIFSKKIASSNSSYDNLKTCITCQIS